MGSLSTGCSINRTPMGEAKKQKALWAPREGKTRANKQQTMWPPHDYTGVLIKAANGLAEISVIQRCPEQATVHMCPTSAVERYWVEQPNSHLKLLNIAFFSLGWGCAIMLASLINHISRANTEQPNKRNQWYKSTLLIRSLHISRFGF